MAGNNGPSVFKSTIRNLVTLVAITLMVLTSARKNFVAATRCVKVDYSEIKDIGEWRYEARINKCEGLPSPYVIKSDVVTDRLNEPTFRQERHHHNCCCRVTDYKEHRTVIGQVELRFKEVLACGCVQCQHDFLQPQHHHHESDSLVHLQPRSDRDNPAQQQQLLQDHPVQYHQHTSACQVPMLLLKYLAKRKS